MNTQRLAKSVTMLPAKRAMCPCRYASRNEIKPRSVRKVFLPNPAKKKMIIPKPPPPPPSFEVSTGPRVNKLGIQMLSKPIREQVFLEKDNSSCSPELIEQCKTSLAKHNMVGKEGDCVKDIDFRIPPLKGRNLLEHFQVIGSEQVEPYKQLLVQLLSNLPEIPSEWVLREGWTRYVAGCAPQQVPYPLENGIVFDVEICMMSGKLPTLATAVSSRAWYAWVSPSLIEGGSKPFTSHQYSLDGLIPLESSEKENGSILTEYMKKPKLVVGHNVSFDRARIKEQYWLPQTGLRFLDTMSLHVCVSGVTSYQRAVLKSGKMNEEDESWSSISSLNSLVEVYRLYCNEKLSKETRDLFIEGTVGEIKENFQTVMHYCSGDVVATYKVLEKVFPMFQERFPHPVTLAGMLEMGMAYLPINDNWNMYISNSEQTYDDLDIEGRILLAQRANNACQLLHDEKYKEDIWMWDQDWEVKNIKVKKRQNIDNESAAASENEDEEVDQSIKRKKTKITDTVAAVARENEDEEVDHLEEKFRYLWDSAKYLSSVQPLLPGYPNWYRKLCTKPGSTPDWVPGPNSISTSMQITPKLLSLTWEGYPLHYLREKGWGFLVPFTDDVEINRRLPLKQLLEKCPLLSAKPSQYLGNEAMATISKTTEDNLMRKEYYERVKKDKTGGLYKGVGIWCNTEIEDCCWFFKLPHKNGAAYNVGNPLAKDFLSKFSENVLSGDTESAEKILAIARMLSYWKNNRARILDQMIVWLDERNLPKKLQKEQVYGAILPQVVVCGTLTRRAMEPTWMTASNAHPERVGSELRAMVQAPKGYSIVGADVDSQELWIASVLGDAQFAKMHGATPFGWMTLSGNKADGTDMHSVTAKAVGISRDHAKVINYARIYGAGQNFAERLLKQFNPSMSDSEAKSKALKMFTLTKGKRIFHLKKEYIMDFPDQAYSKWQAFDIAKTCGKTVEEIFHKPKWVGGTESAMFNRLEEIANQATPRTPFLDCRLSRSLEPKSMSDERYLPTRVNWVVQSGAVDFLHLMLVCMRWIMGDKARFCLSFHDEVRYLVADEHKYTAALAMHVSNLLTRSFCSLKLGLNDLPQSVAFFSSVEVDTVLRKESGHNCSTPSNPHGLDKGYGVSQGESLNIYEAVEKACGQYPIWYQIQSDVKSNQKKARPTGNPSG